MTSPPNGRGDRTKELGMLEDMRMHEAAMATPERPLMKQPVQIIRSTGSSTNSRTSSRHGEELIQGEKKLRKGVMGALKLFRHILPAVNISCRRLALPSGPSERPSFGSRVTGTLFGYRNGHVQFAMQEDPMSQPSLLLELAIPTSSLVKEMASGLVRIALECEKLQGYSNIKLLHEPVWTMFCNGRRVGYALRRACIEADVHLLWLVRAVSMGAGVLPTEEPVQTAEGELMYMRATFERVIGSSDSEAYYMMNPDRSGAPELSIFLLRI
ncbi:hypothetical protein KP509_25G034800 [Ceratopteris richardii]|uniref:Protein MIZU-KUSSEI 1 n=1 Tax=Ceratopteris richardii TaxID=49495 RepID=A0A8T2RRU6_CERRI|nr:hypothetical protein KP509_25G034800 [Ceratopteris richardii]KAH7298275.1 hypothetical protein KP509_25G034800 [Ceratopteris richardii]KAH7298276.1 hypothetical protein KP509_25G034800 [Ceratopteris richardii]